MEVQKTADTDPATAVNNAIKASNNMRPAAFSPFYIWFGPSPPPDGYKRLAHELSGVPMYVKAMPGHEDLLIEQTFPEHPTPGYFALGVRGAGAAPSDYWYVNKRVLVPVDPDGSSVPPMGQMYFDPGLLGFPDNFALQVANCFLAVPDCPVVDPVFDPTFGPGQTTPPGVRRVVVLFKPMLAPNGKFVPSGDYLYLSNEANWVLQNTSSTPEGGEEEVNITVGFSSFDSSRFFKDTKIETSVDVGVVAKMLSLGYSTDVTNEMSVTLVHNESHSSETTIDISVQFPKSNLTQFWQGFSTIVLYASDGTIVSQATNMTRDTRLA